MKKHLLTIAFALAGITAGAQTGVSSPLMHKTDSIIQAWMTNWSVPGGTVAITKDGKLIYNRAFGHEDQAQTITTKPYTRFRLASNSKAITSIAVMKLIQNGQLGIDDTVFGANKILNQPYYLNAITDTRLYKVTVRELLQHTGGWDRDMPCDGYSSCDPISFPLHVAAVMGESNPVHDSTLIKFLLTKGLQHNPGTYYDYSNIGYLVLGKIIEKKTGMKYEDYVASIIMQPLGLCDMQLGKNMLADKLEREGEYNNTYTTLSCYGTGQTVPWQYGGWNLEAMNAHGGWVSTSEDYTRMILAVDGFNTVPDILNATSLALMTTPSSVNANYACGWSVNSAGNWWHYGSLDGTTTFMARTSGGYTWAFHFNYRNPTDPNFTGTLDAVPWNCIAATPTFPSYNLFPPASAASNLTISKTGATAANISWSNGSGDHRVVLATSDTAFGYDFPVEGTVYTANAAYGNGAQFGANTFMVYSGTGNSAVITGLDPLKTYRFAVLEAANNSTTGNNEVYKYDCHPNAAINMASTGIAGVGLSEGLKVYPNPARSNVVLSNSNSTLFGSDAVVVDVSGRILQHFTISRSASQELDISTLGPGIYFLRFANGAVMKLVKE